MVRGVGLVVLLGGEDAHSSGGGEGAVDIEEADGVLDGALGEGRNDACGGGGGGHCGRYVVVYSFCSGVYVYVYGLGLGLVAKLYVSREEGQVFRQESL